MIKRQANDMPYIIVKTAVVKSGMQIPMPVPNDAFVTIDNFPDFMAKWGAVGIITKISLTDVFSPENETIPAYQNLELTIFIRDCDVSLCPGKI